VADSMAESTSSVAVSVAAVSAVELCFGSFAAQKSSTAAGCTALRPAVAAAALELEEREPVACSPGGSEAVAQKASTLGKIGACPLIGPTGCSGCSADKAGTAFARFSAGARTEAEAAGSSRCRLAIGGCERDRLSLGPDATTAATAELLVATVAQPQLYSVARAENCCTAAEEDDIAAEEDGSGSW
jgi:hypothetical protein